MGDLFAAQDEVTSRIAVALDLEMVAAEAVRPADNPAAMDYILRGRAARFRPNSRDRNAERISLFEHALALDPKSVEAQSYLAAALASRVLDNMTDTLSADIARAEGLAGQALASSPRSPLARSAPLRRSHTRIRDRARGQSQLGDRIAHSWPVQALHRIDRGDDPASYSERSGSALSIPSSAFGVGRLGSCICLRP